MYRELVEGGTVVNVSYILKKMKETREESQHFPQMFPTHIIKEKRPAYTLPARKPVESYKPVKQGSEHEHVTKHVRHAGMKTIEILGATPLLEYYPAVEASNCYPGCLGLGVKGEVEARGPQWLVARIEPLTNVKRIEKGFIFIDNSGSLAHGTEAREYVRPGKHEYKVIWFVYPEKPGKVSVKLIIDGKEVTVSAPGEEVRKMCKIYGCKHGALKKQEEHEIQVALPSFPEIRPEEFTKHIEELEKRAISDLKANPSRELYRAWISVVKREGSQLDKAWQAYQILKQVYEYAGELYKWTQSVPENVKEYLQNWPAILLGIARASAELAREIKEDLSPETFTTMSGDFFLKQAEQHARDLLDLYDRLRMVAINARIKPPPRKVIRAQRISEYARAIERIIQEIERLCNYGAKCK